MSQNAVLENDIDSVWASCPADILLLVLQNLDTISVNNCMDVNIYWRSVVEYYCEHVNLWEELIKCSFDDGGATLIDKSKLKWRKQFQSAQRWVDIRNANILLQHCYGNFDCIKNICVYKDNLIINTNSDVKYFDIDNFILKRTVEGVDLKYAETSSMIIEVWYDTDSNFHVVTLTNKLCLRKCKSVKSLLNNINLLKVHLNSCYLINANNVLCMYTATKTKWAAKFLAKYYGNRELLCSVHIHRKKVYILLNRGDVLLVDMECRKLKKILHSHCSFQCALHSELYFMFHIYSFQIIAPNIRTIDQIDVYSRKQKDVLASMFRNGVSCVLDHGHTFILGYESGEIEIYLKRKLTDPIPEVHFNIQTYSDADIPPKVTALDIYEDEKGHHLFVSTVTRVYELLLYN